jgi:hypothetical protein
VAAFQLIGDTTHASTRASRVCDIARTPEKSTNHDARATRKWDSPRTPEPRPLARHSSQLKDGFRTTLQKVCEFLEDNEVGVQRRSAPMRLRPVDGQPPPRALRYSDREGVPMTEAEWLAATEPQFMLAHFRDTWPLVPISLRLPDPLKSDEDEPVIMLCLELRGSLAVRQLLVDAHYQLVPGQIVNGAR